MDPNLIYKLAIWALPIILAITLHEAGHAWAAYKFGDNTAKSLGRVSLNPLPHIDPIGTIILPLFMYLTTPIIFGWAKPVPVISRNFKNPRRDMAWVALAGPGANFLMVAGWAIGYKVISGFDNTAITEGFGHMCLAGIFINLLLAFFNLLPLPPLDGGRVLTAMLPARLSIQLAKVERFGILIVLALFMVAGLGSLLFSLIINSQLLVLNLVGVDQAGAVLQEFFNSLSATQ